MTNSDFHALILEINHFLDSTFDSVDRYFEKAEDVRSFVPETDRWSINQILEHIALTNHFLLILIEKGKKKARKRLENADLEEAIRNYHFNRDKLTEVGIHQSFEWIRPAHMEPKGEQTEIEVRETLRSQLAICHAHLNDLANGEGTLFKTTMSVNALGKIDVYEYIYFLGQHALRHIAQMEKNELAFEATK